jgi:hypothetical protein
MRSGPLPNIPYCALEIDPEDQPKPDLFPCPNQQGTSTENYKHKGSPYASPNRKTTNKPLHKAKNTGRVAHTVRSPKTLAATFFAPFSGLLSWLATYP